MLLVRQELPGGLVHDSGPLVDGSIRLSSMHRHGPATVEPVVTAIDLAAAYRLHPNVAVRPEPFGALVYHYGNRKLVFLKSPRMVAVVKALDAAPSVRAALETNGVAGKNTDRYLVALNSLLASDMLVPSETAEVSRAR